MVSVRTLYVYDTPGRYVLLRGRLLADWLKDHGIPAMRAPLERGYRLHRDRLPDTLAQAEEAGVAVHVREVAR